MRTEQPAPAPRSGWRRLAAGTVDVALAAAHPVPAVTAIGPVRRRLFPRLACRGRTGHVALTLDDGPDPRSTPRFLALLAERRVRATFFLVGQNLDRYPELGREIVAAGHEVAVHGWVHRCLLRYRPAAVRDQLTRATDLIGDVTGQRPHWFRPPFGVFSAAALNTTHRLGLRPALWTCWGLDWTERATPDSVHARVTGGLRDRGTILLHDTASPTAAPDSWRATLGALPRVLDHCADRGWRVGPLAEHGVPGSG